MLYYKATTGCGVMGVEHGVEALQNVQKVEAPWAAARFEGGGRSLASRVPLALV